MVVAQRSWSSEIALKLRPWEGCRAGITGNNLRTACSQHVRATPEDAGFRTIWCRSVADVLAPSRSALNPLRAHHLR
jgi:hypothetical protein